MKKRLIDLFFIQNDAEWGYQYLPQPVFDANEANSNSSNNNIDGNSWTNKMSIKCMTKEFKVKKVRTTTYIAWYAVDSFPGVFQAGQIEKDRIFGKIMWTIW